MKDFKVGDKIQVVDDRSSYFSYEGIVVCAEDQYGFVRVDFGGFQKNFFQYMLDRM